LRGVKRRNDREKDEEEKSFHHWANRLLRNPHPSLLPREKEPLSGAITETREVPASSALGRGLR
jgi:hypothetical protein